MAVVGGVGAAAIAFVVIMTGHLLRDGTGTGDPFDYFRALGDGLSDPATWKVVGWCAVGGAVVAGLAEAVGRAWARRRR